MLGGCRSEIKTEQGLLLPEHDCQADVAPCAIADKEFISQSKWPVRCPGAYQARKLMPSLFLTAPERLTCFPERVVAAEANVAQLVVAHFN
jgi:hypothetical protein